MEIIDILSEAFSAANKRFYQRKQDERIKEMLAAGFDPRSILDEVNPNASSLAKAEREFAKFLKQRDQSNKEKSNLLKDTDLIDKLYDQYSLKDEAAAETLYNEYTFKIKDVGNKKASEWFKNALMNKLGISVEGDEKWDDELTRDFQNLPLSKDDTLPDKMEGHGVADFDVNKLPEEEHSSKSSDRRLKHIILTFKKYMNGVDDPTKSPLNKNKELVAWFDKMINDGKLDIPFEVVEEVFPDVNKDKYDAEDWNIAAGRAIKRIKNANLSDLRKIMSDIMDYGSYKDLPEAKLVNDLVIESSDGIIMLNAGTRILIKENVKILSAEENSNVINNPGTHFQVGVLYNDGELKEAMAAAMRMANNRGYKKSPKFGAPERREDGLVTYFTFSK